MITTTRCPSCRTRFKVSDHELALAGGWVRCGRCSEVFDASWSLRQESAGQSSSTGLVQGVSHSVVGDHMEGHAVMAGSDQSPNPPAEPATAADAVRHVTAPANAAATPLIGPDLEPDFVRQARRRDFWRRPATRAALGVTGLFLLLLLCGQWVMHERNRLAAVYPRLQPLLETLCHRLACSLEPWQQIDALRIDSATVTQRYGEIYQLDVVLRNQTPLPVAVPALELSLTDSQARVVVRRVLTPAELAVAGASIASDGQLSLSLPLRIRLEDGQMMAGYRTHIFYP